MNSLCACAEFRVVSQEVLLPAYTAYLPDNLNVLLLLISFQRGRVLLTEHRACLQNSCSCDKLDRCVRFQSSPL